METKKRSSSLQEIEKLAKSIAEARGASSPTTEDTAKASGLIEQRDALQERVQEVEALRQQYQTLASGIASEMTSAFRSVIDGTKSVNEAFADMFKGIGDKFLDMAMKILTDALTQQLMNLFTGLAGGLGGAGGFGVTPMTSGMKFFADGGRRPMVGEVSLVGENVDRSCLSLILQVGL